ncbi:hypothetical protein [Helicobacter cetorum]|uniref:hypothetical protein n=1 Tax=Helicobacter cetorum TaxID=138563 RepID=UPI000CF09D03|nr:hypothetical protein [Helicobacter cetorum]
MGEKRIIRAKKVCSIRPTGIELFLFLKAQSLKNSSSIIRLTSKAIYSQVKICQAAISKCLQTLEKNDLIEILQTPKVGKVHENFFSIRIKPDLVSKYEISNTDNQILSRILQNSGCANSANALSKYLAIPYEKLLKHLDSLEQKELITQWIVKESYYYKVAYLTEVGTRTAIYLKNFVNQKQSLKGVKDV